MTINANKFSQGLEETHVLLLRGLIYQLQLSCDRFIQNLQD